MKRMSLVILAAPALTLLVSAYGQTRQSVEVTAQTIASQPAGTPYVIDLTRNGNTYLVASAVANRVRVRSLRGESILNDLVRKIGLSGSKFLLGTASDMRAVGFGFPSGRTRTGTGIKCQGDVCTCDAGSDCDRLADLCLRGALLCSRCVGNDCTPEQREPRCGCTITTQPRHKD